MSHWPQRACKRRHARPHLLSPHGEPWTGPPLPTSARSCTECVPPLPEAQARPSGTWRQEAHRDRECGPPARGSRNPARESRALQPRLRELEPMAKLESSWKKEGGGAQTRVTGRSGACHRRVATQWVGSRRPPLSLLEPPALRRDRQLTKSVQHRSERRPVSTMRTG